MYHAIKCYRQGAWIITGYKDALSDAIEYARTQPGWVRVYDAYGEVKWDSKKDK